MGDVSNRTVVALLAVALVVTVVGTVVSVSKLSSLGGTYGMLTGAATGSGTSSVEIDETVGITLADNTVDFGVGHVNIGNAGATVWTNGSYDAEWTASTDPSDQFMSIENTGNVDINLSVSQSSAGIANAEQFFCGASGCADTAVADISIRTGDNQFNLTGESGSCDDFDNLRNTSLYQSLLGTASNNTVDLCADLDFKDSGDLLNVDFRAEVPSDATTGAKTLNLVFTAVSVSQQD